MSTLNRIDAAFADLREHRQKALIAYVTAGDPSLQVTRDVVLALESAGADMVELGLPFSDPLADGSTIQQASQRALQHHITVAKILALVKDIRRCSQIPLALMTYYNPVLQWGEERFVAEAARAGVDGIIIPDLPPEEGETFIQAARQYNVATVFFISPTTSPERRQKIMQSATGFVYYLSVTGVTGARTQLPRALIKDVLTCKKECSQPVCVGFGISTPDQVKAVGKVADGVIVGSAIIRQMECSPDTKRMLSNVKHFVRSLSTALRSV